MRLVPPVGGLGRQIVRFLVYIALVREATRLLNDTFNDFNAWRQGR